MALLAATVLGTLGVAQVTRRRIVADGRAATVDTVIVAVAVSFASWHRALTTHGLGSDMWLSHVTVAVHAGVATFFVAGLSPQPAPGSTRLRRLDVPARGRAGRCGLN